MAGGLNSKRKKRTIEGTVAVDGVALQWMLTSEPQWSNSGDGYKGLCISVKVVGEARRELVIEYPYPKDRNGRPLPVPQRPPVSPKLVEETIRQALAGGWDPASRGKAFVHYVPDAS
jgi:hypothetical protein